MLCVWMSPSRYIISTRKPSSGRHTTHAPRSLFGRGGRNRLIALTFLAGCSWVWVREKASAPWDSLPMHHRIGEPLLLIEWKTQLKTLPSLVLNVRKVISSFKISLQCWLSIVRQTVNCGTNQSTICKRKIMKDLTNFKPSRHKNRTTATYYSKTRRENLRRPENCMLSKL